MNIPSAATAAAITLAALAGAAITASVAGPASHALSPGADDPGPGDGSIARGRYRVSITSCNDCHTAGFAERRGQAPVDTWLTGRDVGYQGPWGTSYPANLRLTVQSLTEEQWLVLARTEKRSPMPWFS